MTLLISSEVAALSSPGTGAGPSFCESVTIFQSPPDHWSSKVHVFQVEVTGSVEFCADIPMSPRYQTDTLASVALYRSTLLPTGIVRETKVLPWGALPAAS